MLGQKSRSRAPQEAVFARPRPCVLLSAAGAAASPDNFATALLFTGRTTSKTLLSRRGRPSTILRPEMRGASARRSARLGAPLQRVTEATTALRLAAPECLPTVQATHRSAHLPRQHNPTTI